MNAKRMVEALCYMGSTEQVGCFTYSNECSDELIYLFGDGELNGELIDGSTYLYAYSDTNAPDDLECYAKHDAAFKLASDGVIVYLYRLELK